MAEAGLKKLLKDFGMDPPDVSSKKFKPVAIYFDAIDALVYARKDCSWREKPLPGGGMSLLLDPYKEEVVGVKIENFSKVASFLIGVNKKTAARIGARFKPLHRQMEQIKKAIAKREKIEKAKK